MSPLSGLATRSGTKTEAYQSKNLRRNTFKVYPSLDAEENPEQASTVILNKAGLLVNTITGPKEAEVLNPSSGAASQQTWHCRYSRCTVNGQIGINGPPPPPVQPRKYLLSRRNSPLLANGQTKSLKSARKTDNTVNNGPTETSKPARRPYNSVNNGLTETSKLTRRPYAVHSDLTETSKLMRKASNAVNNGQTETSKSTRRPYAVHNGSMETSKLTRKAYNAASIGQRETLKSTRRSFNAVNTGRTETSKSTRRPYSVNNSMTETSKSTKRPYAVDNGQMKTSKFSQKSSDKISPLPRRGEEGSEFVSNEGIPLDTKQDLIAQVKLFDNQSSDNSSNSSLCTDIMENEKNLSTVFLTEDNGDLQDEDNQNFPTHDGSSSDNSSTADMDIEEFSYDVLEISKGDIHDEDKNGNMSSDASTEEDIAEMVQKWSDGNEQSGEENHATLYLSTETEMVNQEEKEQDAEEEEVTSFDDDVSSCISTEAGSITHEACCNHKPSLDDSNHACKACEEAVLLRRKRRGYLQPGAAEEQETVNLRRMAIEGRKQCEEFMVDSALENAVLKLAPHGKSKVKVLVTAFETVITTL